MQGRRSTYFAGVDVAALSVHIRVVGEQGANADASFTRDGRASVAASNNLIGRAVLTRETETNDLGCCRLVSDRMPPD